MALRIKSFLSALKGHRTMFLMGFALINFLVLIDYLAFAEKTTTLTLLLSNLPVIALFILTMAGSAQADKAVEGWIARRTNFQAPVKSEGERA